MTTTENQIVDETIESMVSTIGNVAGATKNLVDTYFEKVDSQPNFTGRLTLFYLTENVSKQLSMNGFDCEPIIKTYLNWRGDLQIRPGKLGEICRKNENRIRVVQSPKECAMRHYEKVKAAAAPLIESLFKETLKISVVDLQNKVAEQIGIKPYAAYHCITEYIAQERRDLVVVRGWRGGIEKRQ